MFDSLVAFENGMRGVVGIRVLSSVDGKLVAFAELQDVSGKTVAHTVAERGSGNELDNTWILYDGDTEYRILCMANNEKIGARWLVSYATYNRDEDDLQSGLFLKCYATLGDAHEAVYNCIVNEAIEYIEDVPDSESDQRAYATKIANQWIHCNKPDFISEEHDGIRTMYIIEERCIP